MILVITKISIFVEAQKKTELKKLCFGVERCYAELR